MDVSQSSSRRKRWLLVAVTAALLCLASVWQMSRQIDPHYGEVKRLVSQLGPYRPYHQEPDVSLLKDLARLGPEAYPALARLVQAHDTWLDKRYDQIRARLPDSIRRFLPERQSKDELCQRAKAVVPELGPGAARALVGAVHDALRRRDSFSIGNVELLRSLYWSIPESPKAVATLSNWLTKPDRRQMLFGFVDADEIWPTVPQLGPSLVQWLRFADYAGEAAAGLGAMGSNAVFAIPDLIDTFDNGVAGHPPDTTLVMAYAPGAFAPGMDPLTRNRGAALGALGKIGVASPQVLAALERGMRRSSPSVRAIAADAIGRLGSDALPLLPGLLDKLDTTSRVVLTYQIEAIGKMGPDARDAVAVLHHWADPAVVAALPREPGPGRSMIRWFDDPLPLPGGAAAALVQIAPEKAKGLGKVIAQALTPGPDSQAGLKSIDRLNRLRPLAAEIVLALEPTLNDKRQWVRRLTAFQILVFEPEHEGAMMLLLQAMKDANPPVLRSQAAVYYWQLTGDTEATLPAFVEAFQEGEGPAELDFAAELGAHAKPLVPQIRALLYSDDLHTRERAGKALRRIDPTVLPPINEGYPR
jgi:HEAT repeat protein